MQKPLLIIGLLFISVTSCLSQRTLLDFEPGGTTAWFTFFGADNWTVESQFQIIANPDASGINASDSVALYIEPNEGENWQGMFYKPADFGADLIDFTSGYTELCTKVWMESAGTVTLKAENNTMGLIHESPPIDVSTTGAWVEVCYDFAGSPVDGYAVETFVIFFNILSVPANVTNHYFDDVVQPGIPTSVTYIEDSAFSIYPNPVQEVLRFETDFEVEQVIISDMFGKELSRSFDATQSQVSTTGLTSGVYTISFTDTDGRIGTAKFVKL